MPKGIYDRSKAKPRVKRARTHDAAPKVEPTAVARDRHRFREGDAIREVPILREMRGPHYSDGNIAPVVLQVLLWAHCIREPIPDTPSNIAAIKCLDDYGMIEEEGGFWTTTERGQAYVKALLALPFPQAVTTWVVPARTNGVD